MAAIGLVAQDLPSADDVPFEKKRIAEAQAKLKSQAGPWTTHVRWIERGMLEELDAAVDPRTARGRSGRRAAHAAGKARPLRGLRASR